MAPQVPNRLYCLVQCSFVSLPARFISYCPYAGQRIGEAQNPGPPGSRPLRQSSLLEAWRQEVDDPEPDPHSWVQITVANPTAVLGKADLLVSLDSDILLLAETSAVGSTQATLAGQLRPKGYRCFWSPPVDAHFTLPGRPESRRGHALGAAVMSRLRADAPFQTPPVLLTESRRFSEACVQLGAVAVHVVALYGFPANRPQAALLNEELLAETLQHVSSSRLPCLIGGDFNGPVTQLAIWRARICGASCPLRAVELSPAAAYL